MQSACQSVTTNKPTPDFTGRIRCCRANTSAKTLEGKVYHISRTCSTKAHLGVLTALSLTTKGSWLPWGGGCCQASHQPSDASTPWVDRMNTITFLSTISLVEQFPGAWFWPSRLRLYCLMHSYPELSKDRSRLGRVLHRFSRERTFGITDAKFFAGQIRFPSSLQCFDTVGWVTGRASSL